MRKDIIAATFVHNTEFYSYPVELWEWGLSEFETKVFESRKVEKPGDIATIQNECITELLKDYHNVLWVQADLIFIPEQSHIIMNHLGSNNCFGVRHIKIFHYLYTHHYGCCLLNDASFTEDGAYPKTYNRLTELECAVDAGYIGMANYKNHTNQQIRIWDQEVPEIKLDKDSFIISPTGIYKPLFDYFDLYDEYDKYMT